MHKIINLVCVVCLVLAGGAAVLLSGCTGAEAEKPIKIGALIPMTGKFADYGPKFLAACELRLEEVGYEVAGKPIEFIWEDDGSETTSAQDKARKLAMSDQVCVVAGGIWGPGLVAMAPFWAEQQIPQITWHSQVLETVEHGWTFMPSIPQATSTYLSGVYAYEEMGARTCTIIGADFSSGYRFCGGMMQGFLDSGGKIIQEQWVPTSTVDFGPYLANMEDADFCGFWFPGGQTLLFIKQYSEFGLKDDMPLIIGAGDTIWEEHLLELGDACLGLVGATKYTNQLDTPESKAFVDAWYKKTGRMPDSYDCQAYETISVALGALEATKGDTDTAKIREAIYNLDFVTPAGKLQFSKDAMGIAPQYIVIVEKKDGVLIRKPVKEYAPIEPVVLRTGVTPM